MIEKVVKTILQDYPKNIKFCFAYGSGVFKQKVDSFNNMLDLIFVVHNPCQWHFENINKNPTHYAQPLRFFGHKVITKVQESGGAKVYYNTLIKTSEGRNIKYGVISEISLVEDLLDWNVLYLSGRLHKPVQVIIEPDEKSQLRTALVQNLHSAIHATLILLPEHFSEIEFYKTIVGLSYNGDFRMIFGEDKNKINNIVWPQLNKFKELYSPILKYFDQYIDIPKNNYNDICYQDISPEAKIYHLNKLPRVPQIKLIQIWSQGQKSKDIEDCLRAIAHDPDSSEILDQCLRNIVCKSSIFQSLKGIITAGFIKSVQYSNRKIMKMIKSTKQREKFLPHICDKNFNKSDLHIKSVIKTEIESSSSDKRIKQ
ncbi:PREDICTED: phosphatidate cytidylyltransferase, mitochondrial [Ceratosolen solmsi marchali]|uniref:Phosphatidate cytidylyltransferase, mitochondrial n=1 Tax=Ceratosolen solmsi marchali TaxID=326594 RepID=A0AAJ6YF92_9HYME|nr:PREDICTED: phosphatidate cytidylyltransferase, mitochondrial [Ceratosolen solmsi marchali]